MTIRIATLAFAFVAGIGLASAVAGATEERYTIDASHTFPSFEADHFGVSIWRGKINTTTGTVTLDRSQRRGTVKLTIDPNSIDFGLDALNSWAIGPDFFNTKLYPQASYTGELTAFKQGRPTRVLGQLTLHGVTRPVNLTINSFACKPHPLSKREWCGADASASFKRDEFGLTAGKDYGFKMDVLLRIQVEAVKDE